MIVSMSTIDKLIGRMTLAEKLGQLTMTSAGYAVTGPVIAGDSTDSIRNGTLGNLLNLVGAKHVHDMQRIAVEESRLGIPLLIGFDVIHGHRTIFPVPLAEAATFDPHIWELTARESARETAADGLAMTFAPMLDVSRDLRWGRTVEGPGEDPWLAVQIARAKVRGFQGADLAHPESVAATAKHFCAYGPVTGGRDYASVDISERTLREVHLPAFAAAVQAGAAAIMPAFTELAGIPMTMHKALLRDYLRGELGFDGVIVSDYNAIRELLYHGVAADIVEAAVLALKAGVDIDMMAEAYRKGLPVALERGLVTMDEIDECVLRVLRLKERLGLFDDPYRRGSSAEAAETVAARRRLARDVAAKSLVLAKNSADALPLPEGARRVCVIGPLADAWREMRGPWAAAGYEEPSVTVLAGLREALPNAQVVHAEGVTIAGADASGIAAAVELLASGADVVVLCLGEAAEMSGEAASRAYPGVARRATRARRGRARARPREPNTGRGRAVLRPAADRSVARRAGRRAADRVVPRHGSRERHCRRADGPRVAVRANADHLAARARADSAVLQSAKFRPARKPEGSLHEQVSRLAELAADSFRLRPHLRPFRLHEPDREPGNRDGRGLDRSLRRRDERRRSRGRGNRVPVRSRSSRERCAPDARAERRDEDRPRARRNRHGAVAVAGDGAALLGCRPRAGVRAWRNRDSGRAVR